MAASETPVELLEKIVKSLNTRMDVCRFRAVCKSWRSSIPPFRNKKQVPQFPIRVCNWPFCKITESLVYRLAPPPTDHRCKSSWLIKIEQGDELGKVRMLHPLSSSALQNLPEYAIPAVINLLEYRVFEVAKLYTLVSPDESDSKVAISPFDHVDSPAMCMTIRGEVLWGAKLGDENNITLTELHPKLVDNDGGMSDRFWSSYLHNVMFYKGEFYVVRDNGRTMVVDSDGRTMRTVAYEVFPDLSNRPLYLVESCGELLIVLSFFFFIKDLDFGLGNQCMSRVYKLNADEQGWIMLHDLTDRILISMVGGNSVSVTTTSQDFPGCWGNRICAPWNDETDEIGSFDLDLGIGDLLPLTFSSTYCEDNIFRPPPTWTWFESETNQHDLDHHDMAKTPAEKI